MRRTKTKPRDLRLARLYKWNLLHWKISERYHLYRSLFLSVFSMGKRKWPIKWNVVVTSRFAGRFCSPYSVRPAHGLHPNPNWSWNVPLYAIFKIKLASDATAFTTESVDGAGRRVRGTPCIGNILAQVHRGGRMAHFNYFRLSSEAIKIGWHTSAQLHHWKSVEIKRRLILMIPRSFDRTLRGLVAQSPFEWQRQKRCWFHQKIRSMSCESSEIKMRHSLI